MIEDLPAVFARYEDEDLSFDQIESPPVSRPDLCAMLLLDRLVPREPTTSPNGAHRYYRRILSSASHDQVYLDVEPGELAAVATEADIVTLIRCGVWYDDDLEAFGLFV